MAKCVKMYDGQYAGRIVRIPDNMAAEIVHVEKRGEFVPKSEWKKDPEGAMNYRKGGRI